MEIEKSKKNFQIFLAVTLTGSLVMNLMLISKVNELNNRVDNVSSEQQNLLHSVNGQTNELQQAFNSFKEEQSWLGSVEMDVNTAASGKGQAEALFNWQVKEWQTDSQVFFHYAIGTNIEFEKLQAEQLEQGLFQVKVPITVKLEPLWDVQLSESGSNMEEMSKMEKEAQMDQYSLKYYITVESENVVKSGEIQSESLDYLGTNQFGILQGDIHRSGKNASVTLMQHRTSGETSVIEEAYLLKYQNDRFIGKEALQLEDEQDDNFRLFQLRDISQYKEGMRFVIKVVYQDGTIFEKEVL
jgi:hypothetical protein